MTDVIRYSIILSCFLVSLIIRLTRRMPFSYINLSLFLAAAADIFLIFTNIWAAGILCFMAVQLCYCAAMNGTVSLSRIAAAILYFPLSVINLANAAKHFICLKQKKNRGAMFFAAMALGVLLLLMCDINVVAANLPVFPSGIRAVSRSLIWIFYIPSQIFIVLADFLLADNRYYKQNNSPDNGKQ